MALKSAARQGEPVLAFKHRVIGAGLAAFRATGLHRLASLATRGRGVILALHRVRPFRPETPGYAPNRLLEITPEFLDEALGVVAGLGFEFIRLVDAPRRLATDDAPPFAVVTFDDGSRDTRDFALPVMERRGIPFTTFLATGLIERTARLWWLELEESVRRLDLVEVELGGAGLRLPSRDAAEKATAFERVYWMLRARPEAELLDAVGALAKRAGVASPDLARANFMDWDEAKAFAQSPLVDIGAHSRSHRRLALWPQAEVRAEMAGSRADLQTGLDCEVRTFAYPVGDPTSAAAREFELARELGFEAAVTTRPGMLFAGHAAHATALPRVSLNGLWQDAAHLEVLLSGAPFAIWNRGRRLNVA